MLEIVVCDDDIADLECAVTMLHKIFTSQKIAYHIEQFASANQMLENISNIDIGILDISMEELNGIKLGRKLKEKFPDVKLVYITSYPVMEGTTSKVLNAGIGHIEETAGIGESGNCVLCGHNGSRYGTFFTSLSQISIGDEVMITDKNGLKHIYEVTETEVVNPYDNSIKTQGDEKELTLFTCSRKGTMRFVVRCIYKEAVMDE